MHTQRQEKLFIFHENLGVRLNQHFLVLKAFSSSMQNRCNKACASLPWLQGEMLHRHSSEVQILGACVVTHRAIPDSAFALMLRQASAFA
jgi:hypothetical protein